MTIRDTTPGALAVDTRHGTRIASSATVTFDAFRRYDRVILILVSVIYTVAFHLAYRWLVAPLLDGYGAGYRELSWPSLVLIYVSCTVPALWAPLRLRRPSQLLFYIQYYLIFVPAAFLVFYSSFPLIPENEGQTIVLWMSLGLAVIEAGYLFPTIPIRAPRVKPTLFWILFSVVGIGLFIYEVAAVGKNFRLVNFYEIYSVRSDLGELVTSTGSRFVVYAGSWLNMYFIPLAFTVAITIRRYLLAVAVLVLYVFSYGISGQKAAAFAVFAMPAFYFMLRRYHHNIGAAIAGVFALLLVFSFPLHSLSAQFGTVYVALIPFRLFAAEGLILAQYYDFFRTHPVTMFSHITGINWFVHYPYTLDLPYTLGYYYYGTQVGNNSGIWATDAIGAAGLWAIPLVSAVCAVVFWFLDSCARPFEPRFVTLALVLVAITFSSVSLATTIVTGGLGLMCVTLLFLPQDGRIAAFYLRADRSVVTAPTSSPLSRQ